VPPEPALTLAEPKDYVRTFVDERPPMVTPLEAAAKDGILQGYVRQLVARFRAQAQSAAEQASVNIEPLSERGLYVLRLVATDVDGPDVVRELTVSLRRMRTHPRSILDKLGVSSRRAAVRQAEELDLLSRTRTH
jgi:LuxR family maltose regulon positive regulatory protein